MKIKSKFKYIYFFIISIVIFFFFFLFIIYFYNNDVKLRENTDDINFSELLKVNNEIVGFIKVGGTNINYPVVRSNDNKYYLNHAYDKKKNIKGSIFLDYRNNLDSLSKNNIIYGHGMYDNTMFGSLDNLLTDNWLKNDNNYYIKLYTPNKLLVFKIFSVYTIEKEGYYIKTYFSNKEVYKKFLKTIEKRSIYDFGVNIKTSDKILTLSTCKNNFGKRIVVHAKLI